MNRTASSPLGISIFFPFFFFIFLKNFFKKEKLPYNVGRVDFGILSMRSSRNKLPPIVVAFSTEIMAVHNCEGLTVSMKLVIQALNVTSLTAQKPNDFFKRLKFGTLFSLKRHFGNPAEDCSECAPAVVKESRHAHAFIY